MPDTKSQVRLEDVLGYTIDKYYSDEEMKLIRNVFNDPKLVNVLRKVMLPTIADVSLPVEQIQRDVFLVGRNWEQVPADEAKILITARQEAIKFIIGGLIELKQLASSKDESEVERAFRRSKDSSK